MASCEKNTTLLAFIQKPWHSNNKHLEPTTIDSGSPVLDSDPDLLENSSRSKMRLLQDRGRSITQLLQKELRINEGVCRRFLALLQQCNQSEGSFLPNSKKLWLECAMVKTSLKMWNPQCLEMVLRLILTWDQRQSPRWHSSHLDKNLPTHLPVWAAGGSLN